MSFEDKVNCSIVRNRVLHSNLKLENRVSIDDKQPESSKKVIGAKSLDERSLSLEGQASS